MELQFIVDRERCTGCGECIRECPINLPAMTADNVPAPAGDGECIGCQHCMMVCPTGAVGVLGLDPDASRPLSEDRPSSGQMARLIRGRRSVRQYRQRAVPGETISCLLETALLAPTAVNNRQVTFTVVEDIATMEKIRKSTYDALRDIRANGGLPEGMEYLENRTNENSGSDDFIFRGAPHLLLASSPKDTFCPEVDCVIALSYFELLASSHGLGTLWCGLAKNVFTRIAPQILADLGVPASHTLGYVMAFGEPTVRYQRTFQAGPPKINRARLGTA